MTKSLVSVFGFLFALVTLSHAQAPMPPAKSGTATDIKNSEVEAAAAKSDLVHVLRVVNVDDSTGPYNVVVAVLHRTPKGDTIEEHSDITEVYHIISGSGTFLTGGKIENPRPDPPNPRVGPGFTGKDIRNAASREVGPGDVIVIPPNTPHWFVNVKSENLVYLVVRFDPHRALGMPPADAAGAASGAAAAAAATSTRR
jgi:mannose-6-phosphate isomerase-like protein (cupin superfamily)